MKYAYQAEKFSAARRALMLPHPQGESKSIAASFLECHLGLMDIDTENLDDNARNWLEKLKIFMDTSNIESISDQDPYFDKTQNFSDDQKFEISRIIDELAHWFDSHSL